MDLKEIEKLLRESKTVAVVGFSDNPERPSHRIGTYLMEAGYRVFPVNPGLAEVAGLKCYAKVSDIPGKVDLVDIFRRSEAVEPIVEDAVRAGAGAIWMQDGVVNEPAAEHARKAGLPVVMNDCVLRRHRQLI